MIDPAVAADPERYMRLALDAGRDAGANGEVPVGAVAVLDGEVIATAANARETTHDPTAHAELLAARAAAAHIDDWRLGEVTIVVTLEPCPMCAGAMWAARIGGVVFGAVDMGAGALQSLYDLSSDPRLNHEYPTLGGVLADECGEILSEFFADKREP